MCGGKAYHYLPTPWSGSCYAAYVVPAVQATLEHPNHASSHLYRRTIEAGPVKRCFFLCINSQLWHGNCA
jgi:hypothetical protein